MAPAALLAVLLFAAVGRGLASGQRCARGMEDCSHSACCAKSHHKCFKKDFNYAACMRHCTPGDNKFGPAVFQGKWECKHLKPGKPECAEDKEDCAHLGCCVNKGHKCWRKNPGQAFCRETCPHHEGWDCHELRIRYASGDASHGGHGWDDDDSHGWDEEGGNGWDWKDEDNGGGEMGGGEPHKPPHKEDLSQGWRGGMPGTHYWDCNGQGCDAALLNPWNDNKYVSPEEYAPMDPAENGGAWYGEKIWMVGAASDKLSAVLGPDANGCGADGAGGGGCGQCLLVKTAQSNNPDQLVVIMKKNRCPPWSAGCDKFHMDFAVPGFDNLQYSTANVCGSRPGTGLSKDQSGICAHGPPHTCNCHGIPGHLPKMKKGCELFKAWGWHTGTPHLDWRPVPCPKGFVKKIQAAFTKDGPPARLYDDSIPRNVTRAAAPTGGSAATQLRGALARAQTAQRLLALASLGLLAMLARASVSWLRRGRSHAASSLAAEKEVLTRTEHSGDETQGEAAAS